LEDGSGLITPTLFVMAKIKIADKEYDMLFNVNALQIVGEKYGSLANLHKVLTGEDKSKNQFSAYIFTISTLINQAVLSYNLDIDSGILIGENKKPITEEFISIKMKPKDLILRRLAVFETIADDSNFDSDDDNDDEVLKEINLEKNA